MCVKSVVERVRTQIHDRLGTYGLKEFRAFGRDKSYYEGYCDALEWVVNYAISNAVSEAQVENSVDVDEIPRLSSPFLPNDAESGDVYVLPQGLTRSAPGGHGQKFNGTVIMVVEPDIEIDDSTHPIAEGISQPSSIQVPSEAVESQAFEKGDADSEDK